MKKLYKITFVAILTILWAGCHMEDEPIDYDKDSKINLNLRLEVAMPDNIQLRGTTSEGSEDENRIKNCRVFLFYTTGNQELAAYSALDNIAEPNPSLSLNPFSGSYRLCVVANYDKYGNEIRSYDELRTIIVDRAYLPQSSDVAGELEDNSPAVVMYSERVIDLKPSNIVVNLPVKLNRVVAKLGLKIYNDLANPMQKYIINKITLVNRPASTWLIPRKGEYQSNEMLGVEVIYDNVEGYSPTESDPIVPEIQYMYENISGEVDPLVKDQTKKGDKGLELQKEGKKPAYLLIEGVYLDADNTKNLVSQIVYLGQDNHSDFNVNRNDFHDYTVIIRTKAETDTRVQITTMPEAEFTFTPQKQDAHYVIYPITFDVKNSSGWELVSEKPWLTLITNLSEWQQKGYWIESEAGSDKISGIDGRNITVYAMLKENAQSSASERVATLALKQKSSGEILDQIDITQLPVAWKGSLGMERLEEYYVNEYGEGYPWGFEWNRKVTYRDYGIFGPIITWIVTLIYDSPSVSTKVGFFRFDVTIDYSKLSGTAGAESPSNGAGNTWSLFKFGAGRISQLEEILVNWNLTKVSESGSWNSTEYYAAKMCVMKNKFRLVKHENNIGNVVYTPEINENELMWYLPASSEFPLVDNDYPLSYGYNYWTSTGIAGEASPKAASYKVGGGIESKSRLENLKVRCTRVK